jgi:Major tropism determinant N-terminal domain
MSVQIKLRRDTAANWTSVNPTLASGEPGLETDTLKVKYGNGSSAWNSLSYASNPTGNSYTLPTATPSILGGVKIDGTSITINGSGVITANNTYTLPQAGISSLGVLGGVKVDGSTITINNGVISSGLISAPATATSVGIQGQIAYDSTYVYVCIATNTWKRAALSTW